MPWKTSITAAISRLTPRTKCTLVIMKVKCGWYLRIKTQKMATVLATSLKTVISFSRTRGLERIILLYCFDNFFKLFFNYQCLPLSPILLISNSKSLFRMKLDFSITMFLLTSLPCPNFFLKAILSFMQFVHMSPKLGTMVCPRDFSPKKPLPPC